MASTTMLLRRRRDTGAPVLSTAVTGLNISRAPIKANGAVMKMPDGSIFRKATDRSLMSARMEPLTPHLQSGRAWDSSRKVWYSFDVKTDVGGWYYNHSLLHSHLYPALHMPDLGVSTGGWSRTPSIPTMSRNEAVVKALLKLADEKAGMGENLGTLGQTLRMLCNPVNALASSLRNVWQNRSFRPLLRESYRSLQRKGLLTPTAERYLEYIYGWKPLMQDIHGLVELAKEKGERPLFLKATGTARRAQSPRGGEYVDLSHKSTTAIVGGEGVSTVRCTLHARIDPNYAGSRALNQLGLANPIALAWDLMSWSFVLDWFVPIGPVLHALSAPAGLTFVDGSISNRVSAKADWNNWYNEYASPKFGTPGTGKLHYDGYTRERLLGWPRVGMWIDPNPFRGDRVLKATALHVASVGKLR